MIDYTKIQEHNKMIAQFMGYRYVPFDEGGKINGGYWHNSIPDNQCNLRSSKTKQHKYLCRLHRQLRYFNSWDWLMPVLEKIENLDLKEYFYTWKDNDGETRYNFTGISIEIEDVRVWPYISWELDPSSPILDKNVIVGKNKREAVYEAVIEIIKWYNDGYCMNSSV